MALTRNRSNVCGDFLVPSFHGNVERSLHSGNVQSKTNCLPLAKENRDNSVSSRHRYTQTNKENGFLRSPLKDKNIGDNSNRQIYHTPCSSRTFSQYEDQEDDMQTARNTSGGNLTNLRENCVCLNFKYNQLKEQHGDYIAIERSLNSDEEISTNSSDISLERKYTQVFKPSRPPIVNREHDNRRRKSDHKDKTFATESKNRDLKLILKTLTNIFKTTPPPVTSRDASELEKLNVIVKTLQDEQEKFRALINSQQDQLDKFHSKYIHAENLIKSQKQKIKQLDQTNSQLENELNSNINVLKQQLQDKISEVDNIPQIVKVEKIKADKLSKQNAELIARLQEVKDELAITRAKLVEAAQKRTTTLNKLKASERDLKIFRNQNNILKTEKRSLSEELSRLKCVNDELTARSKNMSRQKERGQTQQSFLQKKILDLELELTRSRNSTSDLIEERDKLIADFHQQLNTLVHNFEVSQKHIRVLRKHIHTITGNSAIPLRT